MCAIQKLPADVALLSPNGWKDLVPLTPEVSNSLSDPPIEEILVAAVPAQLDLKAAAGWVARLKHWTGVDRAIAFTLMARFWSSMAGVVTVLLIARFLTPSEQGYYYTFYSVVALQIVFELGFSFVVLQLAAHERAQLTLLPDGRVEGNAISHSRLASVLQISVRWYSVAGLLMTAALLPAGWYFFSIHQHPGVSVGWRIPWCLLVVASMLAFQIDPVFSFLEGCGFVANVARRRFGQAILGSIFAWEALVTHHGLYAPALVIFGQVTVGLVFLLTRPFRRLVKDLVRYPVGIHNVGWRHEIWPFQWRIAVSFSCGYLIFQLFTPVLFAFAGPIAAGQMGMSLSFANTLQTVALSWISTKSAPFGTMIARKEYVQLDRVFFAALKHSITVCLAGALTVWLGCVYLNIDHSRFAQRLLSPLPFGLLLVAMTINVAVFAEALYLRAHKQEKFLSASILTAILMGLSTYFIGKQFGAVGMVVSYAIINLIVGLGYGTYLFLKYRRIWHEV